MQSNLTATFAIGGASVLSALVLFVAVSLMFGWEDFSVGKAGYALFFAFLAAALTAVPCHWGVRMALRAPGTLQLSLLVGVLNGLIFVPAALLLHRHVANLLGLAEPFALIIAVVALPVLGGLGVGLAWPKRRAGASS